MPWVLKSISQTQTLLNELVEELPEAMQWGWAGFRDYMAKEAKAANGVTPHPVKDALSRHTKRSYVVPHESAEQPFANPRERKQEDPS